jgi:hypothetical protein
LVNEDPQGRAIPGDRRVDGQRGAGGQRGGKGSGKQGAAGQSVHARFLLGGAEAGVTDQNR